MCVSCLVPSYRVLLQLYICNGNSRAGVDTLSMYNRLLGACSDRFVSILRIGHLSKRIYIPFRQ